VSTNVSVDHMGKKREREKKERKSVGSYDECVYVSFVSRQNTTSNGRERKGRKQSSHQHKSGSMQTVL
jgi:hypothetical protein